MALPVQPLPTIGEPNSTEDADVRNALQELQSILSGNVETVNLSAGLQAALSAASPQVGNSIVATEETRLSTSYGLLTTPDRVQNVVLPANGLIAVSYSALWKSTDGGHALAAIFLGSNQLKLDSGVDTGVAVQEAVEATFGYQRLASWAGGLAGGSGVGTSVDVTTGQALGPAVGTAPKFHVGFDLYSLGIGVGGLCLIEAAAGTYDVSVQFKADLGGQTVSVKNRKLRVMVLAF